MGVTRTDVNRYVSDALQRANDDERRKSRAKGMDAPITMEDMFKMLQAQAKFMSIDDEGSDFDIQTQMLQLQQHQIALEKAEMDRRQEAYSYIGKDVLVKKYDPITQKFEGVRGKVDYIEFPKGAREPRLFVDGSPFNFKDIIGIGSVESVVGAESDSIFEAGVSEVRALLEEAKNAKTEVEAEVKAVQGAATKREAQIAMTAINARKKVVNDALTKAQAEVTRLTKAVKDGQQKYDTFKEGAVAEEEKEAQGKVDYSRGQPEKKSKRKDLKAQHLTREDLAEQVAAEQRALAEARAVAKELSGIQEQVGELRKQAAQKLPKK